MSRTRRIHWVAPLCMIGAFIAGVSFAIAHHLFYRSLAGTTVPEHHVFGTGLSRQQMNLAIGTALAFLTKASLVLGTLTSYVQVFWKDVAHKSAGVHLQKLDSLYGAISDIVAICDLRKWCRHPVLLLVAAIAWIIPVASIITPSTLSTQSVPVSPDPVELRYVPCPDFESLSFVDRLTYSGTMDGSGNQSSPSLWGYTGPSPAVLSTANVVLAAGTVLVVPAPAANASWTLNFLGPTLKCSPLPEPQNLRVRQSVAAYLYQDPAHLYDYDPPGYLGWYREWNYSAQPYQAMDMPYRPTEINGSIEFCPGDFSDTFFMFLGSETMMSNWSKDWTANVSLARNGSLDNLPFWIDGQTLACNVLKSTYNVSYSNMGSAQQIAVNTAVVEQQHDWKVPTRVQGAPFGKDGYFKPTDCKAGDLSGDVLPSCILPHETLSALSAEAIMQVFFQALIGSIYHDGFGIVPPNTTILSTILSRLPALAKFNVMYEHDQSLQSILAEHYGQFHGSTSGFTAFNQSYGLREAVEELFRNVTLSMMASPSLRISEDSSKSPRVNVTLPAYHTIYIYSPRKLCLAYGIAILLSAFAIVVGITAMFQNAASYSGSFSTIFRAARGAQINATMSDSDLAGRDPMSQHIRRAKILFPRHELSTRRRSLERLEGNGIRKASDQIPLIPLTPAQSFQTSSAVSFRSSMRPVSPIETDELK